MDIKVLVYELFQRITNKIKGDENRLNNYKHLCLKNVNVMVPVIQTRRQKAENLHLVKNSIGLDQQKLTWWETLHWNIQRIAGDVEKKQVENQTKPKDIIKKKSSEIYSFYFLPQSSIMFHSAEVAL